MNSHKKFYQILIIFVLIFHFFFSPPSVFAMETKVTKANIFVLKKETIKKGVPLQSADKNFQLIIEPQVLKDETAVVIKNVTMLGTPSLSLKEMISPIYEFEIKNKKSYNKSKALFLMVKYPSLNDYKKELYYLDEREYQWKRLKTKSNPNKNLVKGIIHLPYAKIALFSNLKKREIGKASWYRYKNCACAASTEYQRNAKLKVTNLDNNKSLVIKVNDFGPDGVKHPQRIIDLDVKAFKKIAKKGQGVIIVKVEEVGD